MWQQKKGRTAKTEGKLVKTKKKSPCDKSTIPEKMHPSEGRAQKEGNGQGGNHKPHISGGGYE